MRTKISLEIYESEVLKSLVSESKEDTFNFIEKILNTYEAPTEVALELQNHLEDFIDNYQRNEYNEYMLNQSFRPKKRRQRKQIDHKPQRFVDEKVEVV
jgi:hypothetical protein